MINRVSDCIFHCPNARAVRKENKKKRERKRESEREFLDGP